MDFAIVWCKCRMIGEKEQTKGKEFVDGRFLIQVKDLLRRVCNLLLIKD